MQPERHGAPSVRHRHILGMRVDGTSYQDATQRVILWAKAAESRYVCAANVHMVMEAYDQGEFARTVNNADLITPDGKPLVQALRALGLKGASQVRGPNLTLHICEAAAKEGVAIGLYGGTPESLSLFTTFLEKLYPGIKIVCQIAPPFRALTAAEDAAYTQQLVESEARIVFVGIGCPKQELWMAAHQGSLPAVMLGVGAAFDFHSGRVKQAPIWMQQAGLEWVFRLKSEPRRLWKRYAKHNPRFLLFFFTQWLTSLSERRWFEAAGHD
ncbi:WecB/TagA/CpsF family glycosyltransferase [Stenomitos frigidus]|nr:WecB/TagA/CpsF family glycosyltransferase [Stenomitos frigidus]